MKNTVKNNVQASAWVGAASAALLLSAVGLARAQDAVTMAPPVQGAYDTDPGSVPDDASQDTVFNWREVPANQRVPVTRAVFDKGGYQLYDSVGETIIVPFSSDNLYVMKFGISDDGSTYFVNDGSAPTLYLPHDGYLENATVAGAKWYPFPQDYHPAEPVYLGIAPSWDDYVDMGWYPDMAFYGGYYSHGPFISGAVVFPTFGLFINIGGHPYYGWGGYRHYYNYHPDAFRLTIVDNNFYRWGGHPDYARRAYFGGGRYDGYHGYGGGHDFGGGYHSYGNSGGGYGQHDGGYHGFQGGNRTFGNVSGGTRPSGGFNGGGGDHSYGGGGGYQSYGSHTFRGGQGFGGGNSGSHSFGRGDRSFGGGNFGGGGTSGSGGHSFGGGSYGGGNRTFGNASGNSRPSGGGSFGGGNSGGGDHSFSGGGNPGGFGGGHSFSGGGGGGFHGGGGWGGHSR